MANGTGPGFCGSFPEPEVGKGKKEEKACCNSGDCGCGFGPVQEGSVKDASGIGLSQKNETHTKMEYVIVTKDEEYLIDVHDPRQDKDAIWIIQILMNLMNDKISPHLGLWITVFGLKRGEVSYRRHWVHPNMVIRVIPWNLEKWKVETSEGIV